MTNNARNIYMYTTISSYWTENGRNYYCKLVHVLEPIGFNIIKRV